MQRIQREMLRLGKLPMLMVPWLGSSAGQRELERITSLHVQCIEGQPGTAAPGHLVWMEGPPQASLTENFKFPESLQSFECMTKLIFV